MSILKAMIIFDHFEVIGKWILKVVLVRITFVLHKLLSELFFLVFQIKLIHVVLETERLFSLVGVKALSC